MESFPPTPVTNYGITLLEEGIEPHITYISPEGEVVFYLNGGLAPWPGVTEGIVLADGMEGLHATFNHLDHKGARQAGATWTDTVYDPAEMSMEVTATARTPEGLRKVIRKWMAAWDPTKTGTLSWVTPDGGEWWCHPRLNRPPPEKLARTMARSKEQKFTWSIRNDDAFWRSHDSISEWHIPFNRSRDEFTRNDAGTLGASWDQTYSGPGAGVCETDGTRAVWTPSGTAERTVVNRWLGNDEIQTVTVNGSPDSWQLTYDGATTTAIAHPASAATVQTRLEALGNIGGGDVSVIGPTGGPYRVTFTGALGKRNVPEMIGAITGGGINPFVQVAKTFDGQPAKTESDSQIVRVKLESLYKWPWPVNARLDIWGRLNDAGNTGVRVRISHNQIRLSRFDAGTEHILYTRNTILPPLWGEEWVFLLGASSNARHFKVLRSGFLVLEFKETGAASPLGPSYRGAGFGMRAGAGTTTQDTPATVWEFSLGDNVAVTSSGHISLTNYGDQEGWPDLIVYGPGTFYFGDGPGRPPTVEFGPLANGQVALVKTHPGHRGVYDLTAEHTEHDLPFFQSFIKSLFGLAFNNNVPPMMDWFQSFFGISPPQGNLYARLKGRWTRGIPPRPLGDLPETSQIAVKVVNGTVDSKVVAALTPMRRWPE